MDIQAIAKEYYPYLIEQRRWFHAHPEIAEKEFETSRHVKEELTRWGITWRPCGLETGILATVVGANPGKTILLRGDMDALPVTEETGLPYASQNPGFMHACGAVWPQHSAKYRVDEDALLNAVMLYVQVALDHNAK